jgi:uncharacterized repeat protein (TIGR01451 family)
MTMNNEYSAVRRLVKGALVTACAALAFAISPGAASAQGTGADVSVLKTAPNEPFPANSLITYTITVESNGPANASNVQVRDVVPANMTFVSVTEPDGWNCVTPAPGGTGLIQCSTPSLPIGSVVQFEVTLRLNNEVNAGVRVTNTAEVVSTTPDPLPINNTSSYTFVVAGSDTDTAGIYDGNNGTFFLRNLNGAGTADNTFLFGVGGAGIFPIEGDWNNDGIDTVGLYNQATGTFFLKNTNASGNADITFIYGAANAGWIPIVGDWNNDGIDTIGLYDPATSTFFLKNSNASGNADITFQFGLPGNYTPLAGDWNGDGVDTIGLYSPATATFFLKNSNAAGNADLSFVYGTAFQSPVTGDWNGDGVDTIGIVDTSSATWFLKNTNAAGNADVTFVYGFPNATPIEGDWNGQ